MHHWGKIILSTCRLVSIFLDFDVVFGCSWEIEDSRDVCVESNTSSPLTASTISNMLVKQTKLQLSASVTLSPSKAGKDNHLRGLWYNC